MTVCPRSLFAKGFHALQLRKNRHVVRQPKRAGLHAHLERLEERALLTVDLSGVPNWIFEGPAPINNAQLTAAPNNAAAGAINSIAVNPLNAAQIVIGTVNGGIWETTNANPASPGTINWTPLTDQLPSLAIGSVAFSPLDATGNTLYAGTGSFSNGFDGPQPDGALRTTDGGATWTVLASQTFQGQRIETILPTGVNLGPGTKEVILASTVGNADNNWLAGGGLFESKNNGDTFTVLTGNGLPTGSVTSLIADPNNASQFFAAIPKQGIFKGISDAQGTITWTESDTNVTGIVDSTDITLTAQSIAGVTTLFTTVSKDDSIEAAFTSGNAGAAWTALATPPAPNSNFAGAGSAFNHKVNLVADPVNAGVIYMSGQGTDNVFRYDPAGAGNWVLIVDGGAQGNTQPHADARGLAFLGNTTLLEVDDGGFYFLNNPTNATANSWQNFNRTLGATEAYKIAYDANNNLILAGNQDNGSNVQTATGSTIWNQYSGGDGGSLAYDSVNSINYTMANNFGFWTRNGTQLHLKGAAASPDFSGLNSTKASGGFGTDRSFVGNSGGFNVVPFVLNSTDPTQMLIGRQGLYTGTGPNTGDIITEVTPANMEIANALIFGGQRAGTAQANVIIAGDTAGNLFIRGESGSTFNEVTGPGSGGIVSLAVDPQDWRRVYVVQGTTLRSGSPNFANCQVFVTDNITDLTNHPFRDITGNLKSPTLTNGAMRAITLFDNTPGTVGDSVPIVAGVGGVYRLLNGAWSRYGSALPNAVAEDIQYVTSQDLLIVGTFGRGEWEVPNVSTTIRTPGILTIVGDTDFVNEDDTIKLVRNPDNPAMLDVYLNSSSPIATYPLAVVQQINVFGLGGNDELTVDSTNGLITAPNGIHYSGDSGANSLRLVQTGGPGQSSDVYSVVPTIGKGSDVITGATGVQTVDFEDLAPVFDNVPGALLVLGTQANDTINYSQGASTSEGLVTVNNLEPIDFTNKTLLTIDALAGDDTITLNNVNRPTGLVAIPVDGGLGNNTLVIDANNQLVSSSDFTASSIFIPVATPVGVGYTNIAQVRVVHAFGQLIGTGTGFSGVEGIPLNNVLVGAFNFLDIAGSPPVIGNASDFTTVIDWGDGTGPGAGTIVGVGAMGFQVFGTHTYADEKAPFYELTFTTIEKGATRTFFIPGPGGASVTIVDNPGASTNPTASAAFIVDAPLIAAGALVSGAEGTPLPPTTLVASFSDANPRATVADFTTGAGSIVINWGDGTTPVTVPAGNITAIGSPNGVTFKIFGSHTFVEEGTYQVTATITDTGGSATVAHSAATIGDLPPTAAPIQPTVSGTEGLPLINVNVASFIEEFGVPHELVGDYSATIDWGDGTSRETGVITRPGAPGGPFFVSGTHTYGDSGVNGGVGTYPIVVTIHDDGGTTLTIGNTAHIADVPITLTGQLNPASDSGKSHSDGITNVNQPNFFGTSEPNSHVSLFSTPTGGSGATLIGQGVADASGFWSITSDRLADGSYTITATAVDASGHTTTTAPLSILPNLKEGPLVIDTVGPRATAVSFDRLTGKVLLTFQDDRSGMLQQTLVDAANFAFNKQHSRPLGRFIITSLTVSGGPGATDPQSVEAVINHGAYLRGGFYQIIAHAASVVLPSGIQDLAGNALDGEFYGPATATGNGVPGGDLIANLDAIHNVVFPPKTVIGFPHPNDPPGQGSQKPISSRRPGHTVEAGPTFQKTIRRVITANVPHPGNGGQRVHNPFALRARSTGSKRAASHSGSARPTPSSAHAGKHTENNQVPAPIPSWLG